MWRVTIAAVCTAGALGSAPKVVLEPGAMAAETMSWQLGRRATAADVVRPIFMLRHEEEELQAFEKTFWAVSTPGNARYGHFLTAQEVAQQLPVMSGAKDAVLAWLVSHGVEGATVSPSGDMIEAAIPVDTAELMFDTRLHHFTMNATGADIIRAVTPYAVPSALSHYLYVVGDLVHLPGLRIAKGAELGGDDDDQPGSDWPTACGPLCRSATTPAVLQAAYGLPSSANATETGASMAVAEFQGVTWDQGDLDHFQKTCRLPKNVTVDTSIGTRAGFTCKAPLIGGTLCTEALLDVEYIKAVAPDVPLTGISDLRYSLLKWTQTLDGLADLPLVHSVSYGNDEVQQSSGSFMDAVSAQFMKLGARGVSILFASGDQGVYGRTGKTSDGKFHPDFPAASPYVTAVGGTDFAQKSVIGPEKAWASGGGGFSDHFPAPAYQQAAVENYIAEAGAQGKLPAASHWNATGRGYPDVAALGGQQNPYCVAVSLFVVSTMMGVAGTSASCPVVAGMVARLNALRAQHGQPAMGFINPFIYAHPEAFNDVVLGVNNDGGPEGFAALAGWDPATGMGTPNFPKLAAAALAAGRAAAFGGEVAILV